jgi:hypothetical protein
MEILEIMKIFSSTDSSKTIKQTKLKQESLSATITYWTTLKAYHRGMSQLLSTAVHSFSISQPCLYPWLKVTLASTATNTQCSFTMQYMRYHLLRWRSYSFSIFKGRSTTFRHCKSTSSISWKLWLVSLQESTSSLMCSSWCKCFGVNIGGCSSLEQYAWSWAVSTKYSCFSNSLRRTNLSSS